MDSHPKSKVVRIVRVSEQADEKELKEFIVRQVQLKGDIRHIFVGTDLALGLSYAYVFFQYVADARKTVKALNGFCYQDHKLEVGPIGKEFGHKRYHGISKFLPETLQQSITRTSTGFYYKPKHAENRNCTVSSATTNLLAIRTTQRTRYQYILPPNSRTISSPALFSRPGASSPTSAVPNLLEQPHRLRIPPELFHLH